MLSICLCSWDDLPFLKILYNSIKKNTKVPYEIIIHDNGSTDGTIDWLRTNKILHTRSQQNEGVAAVNYAAARAAYPYLVDINSDMYVLPGWDIELVKQIKEFESKGIKKFTLSSCLIEPIGNNPEYSIRNHGHSPETFNEQELMQDYFINRLKLLRPDTIQYSHPITMPRSLWEEMGGVDTEYPFGLATDHDIAVRAYNKGCRNFKMLGKSRVYHFVGQTIRKIPNRPNAEPLFEKKWGITVQEFRKRLGVAQPFKQVADNIL